MTKPTTPGIAELLDALQRATAMREGVQEAKSAVLSYVAGLEHERDRFLIFTKEIALGAYRIHEAERRAKEIIAIAQRGGNDV